MIHGWTGDENSMWVFTRGFPSDYWIVAPRAPHAAESKGFSWRPPQPLTFGRPSLETLLPAAEGLIQLIDEYSASVKLDARQFDLIGFSQGGAMVNVVGLLYPDRVRKMGVLAGFLPLVWKMSLKRNRSLEKMFLWRTARRMKWFQWIAHALRCRSWIGLGAQITYCEDDVAHKLSSNCLRALGKLSGEFSLTSDSAT